jgi:hypothetical protein
MKKHILIVTLIAGASLAFASAEDPSPSPVPVASPGPTRCPQSSANVEVHSFYGSKKTVADEVADLPVNLSERRVFIQITQSGRTKSANTSVKLFEQQNGEFTVTEWTGADASGLFNEIDDTIIRDKGKNCVGEAIKAVLTKKLRGWKKTESSLPASASPKDAFTPSVGAASGDFFKSAVIFGC